jgi:signal peptidase II
VTGAGLWFLAVAMVTVAIDQASKAWAVARLNRGRSIAVGRWLRLRRVHNRAGLIGWPRRGSAVAFLALLTAGITVSASYLPLLHSLRGLVGLGLVVGGAGGNLIDRLRHDGVTDFIDLGWWPIFNLADVAIVVGIILALSSLASA